MRNISRICICIPVYCVVFFLAKEISSAENENAVIPKSEQIARLVELAWKPTPNSIDATVYVTVNRPVVDRAELEKKVRDIYSNVEKNSNNTQTTTPELEKSIATEVERLMKEQQSPAVIKKRVRWNGIQYREDKVSAEGDIVIDSNTEFNRVIVNSGNPLLKDYTSFEYDLTKKIASINDKPGSRWKEDRVWTAYGIQPISVFIKALTMIPPKEGETNFVQTISPEKVSALQNDEDETFYFRYNPDKYKSYNVDRFEVKSRTIPDFPIMIFYCDRNDYSKLYRSETYDPKSGTLLHVDERDKFDQNGFPKVWITEEYTPNTSYVRRAEHVFENVSIDVEFASEIFEFNPPNTFSTIDNRPASPVVTEPLVNTFGMEEYDLPQKKRFTLLNLFLMISGALLIFITVVHIVYHRLRHE